MIHPMLRQGTSGHSVCTDKSVARGISVDTPAMSISLSISVSHPRFGCDRDLQAFYPWVLIQHELYESFFISVFFLRFNYDLVINFEHQGKTVLLAIPNTLALDINL